jgi:hypothetical protein
MHQLRDGAYMITCPLPPDAHEALKVVRDAATQFLKRCDCTLRSNLELKARFRMLDELKEFLPQVEQDGESILHLQNYYLRALKNAYLVTRQDLWKLVHEANERNMPQKTVNEMVIAFLGIPDNHPGDCYPDDSLNRAFAPYFSAAGVHSFKDIENRIIRVNEIKYIDQEDRTERNMPQRSKRIPPLPEVDPKNAKDMFIKLSLIQLRYHWGVITLQKYRKLLLEHYEAREAFLLDLVQADFYTRHADELNLAMCNYLSIDYTKPNSTVTEAMAIAYRKCFKDAQVSSIDDLRCSCSSCPDVSKEEETTTIDKEKCSNERSA